jgi:hypothetical protein
MIVGGVALLSRQEQTAERARTEFPLQSRGAWLWVSTCKWFIAGSNRETDEENRNAATDQ